jgi:hypothetical protein
MPSFLDVMTKFIQLVTRTNFGIGKIGRRRKKGEKRGERGRKRERERKRGREREREREKDREREGINIPSVWLASFLLPDTCDK